MNTSIQYIDVTDVARDSSSLVHTGLAKTSNVSLDPLLRPVAHYEDKIDVTLMYSIGDAVTESMHKRLEDCCREAKRLYRYNGTWGNVYIVVLRWTYVDWNICITTELFVTSL